MPLTQVSPGLLDSNAQYYGFKNRIINGAMVIDQRNNGASVTPASNNYTVDRWQYNGTQASKFTVQRNAGAVTPPSGFTNYLGFTVASAVSVAASDFFVTRHHIEGFNVADLGWGTAGAQTVTLSFQVRSSLTGTFGGSLVNSDQNRSYPFTFTISAANTFEAKTVTILGDTSGTWLTNNGRGITLAFNLGSGSTYSGTANTWAGALYFAPTGATSVVGTSGATFYITGVQLEKGSTATSFDYRPYGTELALCQRYYYRIKAGAVGDNFNVGYCDSTTVAPLMLSFPVSMRTPPTALEQSGTAGDYTVVHAGANTTCSSVPSFSTATTDNSRVNFTVASGFTAGRGAIGRAANTSAYLAWSAEL
jgi:hypothetical protein